MTRNPLTSGSRSDDVAVYVTGPFKPGASRLVLAFVVGQRDGNGDSQTPTVRGNGLTWELVRSVTLANRPERRLSCFRAAGPAPILEPLTIDFGAQRQQLCGWSVFEYDGAETGLAALPQVQQAQLKGTTITVPLGPLIDPAASRLVGALTLDGSRTVTPLDAFFEIDELLIQSPDCTFQTQDREGGGASVSWNWASAEHAAALAVEIRPSSSPVVDEPEPGTPPSVMDLARRFEPFVYFHPDERFFPSDAKRYLEHAALWSARAPFDVKEVWGGDLAQALPRAPIPGFAHEQVAGVAGEPGSLLGDGNSAPATPDEEQFFELAGWRDETGAAQAGVTPAGKNTYSNRDEIGRRYNNSDADGGRAALRESRFWYHVELLEADALKQVIRTIPAPDVSRELEPLKNPALLNYYLFFPAHEEALQSSCTNVEAKEFACFAGEWACVAVLLERATPTASYRPRYLGYTGHVLQPDDPVAATDPADPARRVVMRVEPFENSRRRDDHVKLFVARGTHSLYPLPKDYEVHYAAGTAWQDCGRQLKAPPVTTEPTKFPTFDPIGIPDALFWTKIIAGNALFSPLGPAAPIGAALGALWSYLEVAGMVALQPKQFTFVSADDQPAPDVAPEPAQAKVVRPAGLDPEDGSTNFQDWVSTDNLQIGGRTYDCRVDRTAQRWWPSLDRSAGFRGRWGPRVEHDPQARRAGMLFPPFPQMFLLALAEAKVR
jgi:hypothetical protein